MPTLLYIISMILFLICVVNNTTSKCCQNRCACYHCLLHHMRRNITRIVPYNKTYSTLNWLVLGFLYTIFPTMEFICDLLPYPSPPTYTTPPPPHTFWAPKVFFYAQTQCSFVTHTHISKRYFPYLQGKTWQFSHRK